MTNRIFLTLISLLLASPSFAVDIRMNLQTSISSMSDSDENDFLHSDDFELDSLLNQVFHATRPGPSRNSTYGQGRPASCSSFEGTLNGRASYYGAGEGFVGGRTYCGTTFTSRGLTAALKQGQLTRSGQGSSFKCGALAKVTNKANGKSVWVTLDDTGSMTSSRVIDLSLAAARELDFVDEGVTSVTVQVCATN